MTEYNRRGGKNLLFYRNRTAHSAEGVGVCFHTRIIG